MGQDAELHVLLPSSIASTSWTPYQTAHHRICCMCSCELHDVPTFGSIKKRMRAFHLISSTCMVHMLHKPLTSVTLPGATCRPGASPAWLMTLAYMFFGCSGCPGLMCSMNWGGIEPFTWQQTCFHPLKCVDRPAAGFTPASQRCNWGQEFGPLRMGMVLGLMFSKPCRRYTVHHAVMNSTQLHQPLITKQYSCSLACALQSHAVQYMCGTVLQSTHPFLQHEGVGFASQVLPIGLQLVLMLQMHNAQV